MNKKLMVFGLFLLIFCVFVNAHVETASEDYVIAEKKFLEAQKKFFYQTIVEMHKNGQMTKEAIDELRQKFGIEDLKKVMEERKKKFASKNTEMGVTGLAYGITTMVSLYGIKIFFDCIKSDDAVTINMNIGEKLQWNANENKRFEESCRNKGWYVVVGLLGAGFGINGLRKLYVHEQKRRKKLLMLEEIIKELDKIQVLDEATHV